jgi:hypothetical protein
MSGEGEVEGKRTRPRSGDVAGGGGLTVDSSDEAEERAVLSAAGNGLLDEKDPAVRKRREEASRRLAAQGVPLEILKASGEIVTGQVHPVKGPKESLKELKNIADVAAIMTAPVGFAPMMDIKVEALPMFIDLEEQT